MTVQACYEPTTGAARCLPTTGAARCLWNQDEVWTTVKRYFDMTAYWLWRERTPAQPTLFQEPQETPMLQPA